MSTDIGSAAAGNPAAAGAPDQGGAAGAAQGGAPAQQTPQSAPQPSGIDWLPGADEITVGYVQNKGWKDPSSAIESYRNLEKLLGAERAGRTVELPGEGADQAALDAFYNRLGRPADAKAYDIPVPEGYGDPKLADSAREVFHKAGLTSTQAKAVAEWWNSYVGETMQAQQAAKQQAFDQDHASLQKDWGAAFNQNKEVAARARREFGISDEQLDALDAAMGHKGTMEFLHRIGSKLMDDSFVSGDRSNDIGSALTPGQAKAEIEALKADKSFVQKYLNGDKEARDKMARLMKFAYPDEA